VASIFTPLEQYLLSAPVPGLDLPALIEPSEYDLYERAETLGWDGERDGVGGLLFTLRLNGTLVVFCNEILEIIGANNARKD
jgi:hypothetical protein